MTALTEREVAPADRSSRENDSEVGVWPALVAGPRDGARVSRSVSALDACHAARQAWERQDQQTSIDLWGDSPDHVEGHSRITGGQAASRAGNGKRTPAALDYPVALNARPGPETARGPHAPISPPGSSVEGMADDGRKGELRPRRALTDNQARSVRSTDAPEARSREEVMNESDESTKVGVEVETPQPEPQETQTTEVEVETPEGQPDVEVEVETPKPA